MKNSMSFQPISRPMLKPLVGAALLVAFQAHAQQAGIPNAGTILQQQQPALPPAHHSDRPSLQVRPANAPTLPNTAPFQIKSIRIVGNAAFSNDTLHALVADAEGKTVTLPDLEQLAARITAYYQAHGFSLSRAIVPAQTIADGQVTLQVIEAKYGAVRLNNTSQVTDRLLTATMAPLRQGDSIADTALDRTLLLLSDIPGLAVDATIKPGFEVGTADLDIATGPAPAVFANVVADNAGNRYIGRARLGATFYVTNPLHQGDVLDAGVISTGRGMDYGRIGYEMLLNGQGTRAGAAISSVRYRLRNGVEAIDAHGTATVGSLWIKQPFVRARQANVYAQLEYDDKRLRDHIGVTDTRTDRHLGDWMLSLNGDLRNGVLDGGVTSWSVGTTFGQTSFDDTVARGADAASARTAGHFAKLNANGTHLQRLGARDSLVVSFGAQWADSNLDSAEKMTIGGPFSVRAYDIGAISADTGYTVSTEWRRDLGEFANGGWQAIGFVDSARVTINRDPWTPGQNTARLSGAGVGLTWSGLHLWHASMWIAAPIGATPTLLGDQPSARGWINLGKMF